MSRIVNPSRASALVAGKGLFASLGLKEAHDTWEKIRDDTNGCHLPQLEAVLGCAAALPDPQFDDLLLQGAMFAGLTTVAALTTASVGFGLYGWLKSRAAHKRPVCAPKKHRSNRHLPSAGAKKARSHTYH